MVKIKDLGKLLELKLHSNGRWAEGQEDRLNLDLQMAKQALRLRQQGQYKVVARELIGMGKGIKLG